MLLSKFSLASWDQSISLSPQNSWNDPIIDVSINESFNEFQFLRLGSSRELSTFRRINNRGFN